MNTPSTDAPDIEALIDTLQAIDPNELDVQYQLLQLRKGQDWNFYVIPITVLILMAGSAIGLYLGHLVAGFAGGAVLSLLIGYSYHVWDLQWQKAAKQRVVDVINAIEGETGFLPYFKSILAKSTYRVLFYKLKKRNEIEIEDYVRAIRRLQSKDTALLRERLLQVYPPPEPEHEPTLNPEETSDLMNGEATTAS